MVCLAVACNDLSRCELLVTGRGGLLYTLIRHFVSAYVPLKELGAAEVTSLHQNTILTL